MHPQFSTKDQNLFYRKGMETVWIQPWGINGIRVRATLLPEFSPLQWALLDQPAQPDAFIDINEDQSVLSNGKIQVEISNTGRLRFLNTSTGNVLLEEVPYRFYRPPSRDFHVSGGNNFHLEVNFLSKAGERFYGLGQHQHGKLNQKGCVIDLAQRNTEVCIPFLLSNRGYGFLWNNPAVGRVELAENATRWVAESTRQMDYYIVAGDTPSEMLERYTTATGKPHQIPEWALGFWQCKLRYRTQDELLNIAREYKKRGLPLSIIVVDYFHWTMMGDWQFDPNYWPDPSAMVKELKEIGVELMVSVWGTVNPNSPNYQKMYDQGLLVMADHGLPGFLQIDDIRPGGPVRVAYYDATNPVARKFVVDQVMKNYHDLGIRVLWLDADEPEIYPMHYENLRYHLGNGLEVTNVYPFLHQQGFYEGMQTAGEAEFIFLSRSAWAGSQRYAAVWSGDITSTFETLQQQVRAGLNIGLSGIPWWTTDIGGFMGGDIRSPEFRELIVRWFQYGTFCPLFRLHGARNPSNGESGALFSGADNEVWSFGEPAYAVIKKLLFLREKLRPYLMELNQTAHQRGFPPMRPLFFDFPQEQAAWDIDTQFMLGPDLLIAPVLEQGQRERQVYLPKGSSWVDAWTGTEHPGGQYIVKEAPLEIVPVYWRKGSPWMFAFNEL